MESRNYAKEGIILMIGGMQFMVAMMIAEALHSGYSLANNYVSDLGVGPGALWFNVSIVIFGACIVYGAYLLLKPFPKFSMLLMLSGLAAITVGVFTEHHHAIHSGAAFVTFVASGICAVYAYWIMKPPLNYLSLAIGIISLIAMGLFRLDITIGIGIGGVERLIVYPVVLWVIGFGGYLIGLSEK